MRTSIIVDMGNDKFVKHTFINQEASLAIGLCGGKMRVGRAE